MTLQSVPWDLATPSLPSPVGFSSITDYSFTDLFIASPIYTGTIAHFFRLIRMLWFMYRWCKREVNQGHYLQVEISICLTPGKSIFYGASPVHLLLELFVCFLVLLQHCSGIILVSYSKITPGSTKELRFNTCCLHAKNVQYSSRMSSWPYLMGFESDFIYQ